MRQNLVAIVTVVLANQLIWIFYGELCCAWDFHPMTRGSCSFRGVYMTMQTCHILFEN